MTTTNFWDRFSLFVDKWENDNPAMATAAKAANFAVTHTGGGCMALECLDQSSGIWVLLTDGDADLPTDLDQQCCAGGTDNESGGSVGGIDEVTPREFFTVHKTFAKLCALLLARDENADYSHVPHMLSAARVGGCFHPDEADAIARIMEREALK